jgi:hypothetical protein
LIDEVYTITGGAGSASQACIRHAGYRTRGETFVDDSLADGITPTRAEAAERIRAAFRNDELRLIPKPK